jgi:probable F420-dependent oxidoreductase
MTLGAVLPFWLDRPAEEALGVAAAAEDAGCEELWIGEMVTFDAFALAGAIARDTARLTLRIGPLAVAVRDPAALALGVQSVSVLGGRPAKLALGSSTPLIVEAWHGRTWQPCVLRMRETVAALRPLLAGERAHFAGREVRCEGFRLRGTLPSGELTIAAFGPQMVQAAAELADRVVLNLVTPAQVAQVRAALEGSAAGRGEPAPPITVWVPVAAEPGEPTRAQVAGQLAVYVAAPGYAEMFVAAGFGQVVDRARSGIGRRELQDAIEDDLIETVCAYGSNEAIAERLSAYVDAGAETIAAVPATAEDPDGRGALAAAARWARR